jgi:hypothetical protein
MPATNTLFALLAVANPDALEPVIKDKFPDSSLKVAPGEWLIAAPSTTTTVELSNQLGITDGSSSNAVVLSVTSYYGRVSVSVWEWIAAKTGATQNVSQAG